MFSQVLATLLSIRVKRPLPAPEAARLRASRASELGKLRIADATAMGPQQYALLAAGPEHPVVIFDDRAGFESSIPSLTIEQLGQGCAVLGAQKR